MIESILVIGTYGVYFRNFCEKGRGRKRVLLVKVLHHIVGCYYRLHFLLYIQLHLVNYVESYYYELRVEFLLSYSY